MDTGVEANKEDDMNSHAVLHSHCSVKRSGRRAFVKMQNNVDALQEKIRMLNHLKEAFASVWATSAKEAMEKGRRH